MDSFETTFEVVEKTFSTFTSLTSSNAACLYFITKTIVKSSVNNLLVSSQNSRNCLDVGRSIIYERTGLTHSNNSAIGKTFAKVKSL
ncbi:hypothetical protein [Streptococcus castoreus]|uniref:hypothetical protein n=1 Tax=Streptococcus castoreus TaxID=254786 RepID=UPI0004854106|nr:hypothetical protein [Streptococcus castoreus]